MKLHFESDLPYQIEASNRCVPCFAARKSAAQCSPSRRRPWAVGTSRALKASTSPKAAALAMPCNCIVDEELNANLQKVQLRNGLPPSDPLNATQPLDFTVEMETGTGKTYVYLRTVFELNQRYGFTKFVVVVPSVAIKEGVNKTLQITREHFESLYPGAKGYEFFQYDSDKLGQVRNFATSPNIQIMVITVGAINKFGDEAAAQAEESDEASAAKSPRTRCTVPARRQAVSVPIDLIRAKPALS
jgi:type III restriction enzyme